MAEKIAELYADFTIKTGDFDKEVDKAKKKVGFFSYALSKAKDQNNDFGKSLKQLKFAAIAASGALMFFFKNSVEASIEAQETNQKFAVTFREVSKEAEAASKSLAENYGLAQDEAKKLLSDTGDLLSGFGFTGKEALNLSENVNKLAVDLASFSNVEGGAARASEILTKAMLGERDSLVALGIKVTETQVKEELKRRGLEKSTGQSLLAAKAQITYDLALKQSKNSIGDFNRSQNSSANVLRRVKARMRDTSVEIGNELTPALTDLGITFLETSKDGGIISDALKNLSIIIGAVVRSVASLVEGLNLLRNRQEQKEINESMNKYGKSLLQVNKYMKQLGVSTIGQLKELSKTNEKAKILYNHYLKISKIGKGLRDLSGDNADRIKRSADNLDDLQSKIWESNDATEESIKKREKEKDELDKILDSEKKLTNEKKKQLSVSQSAMAILSQTSTFASQLSSLYQMAASNEQMVIDNRTRKQEEAIEQQYELDRQRIETTITNEKEKNEALKSLDEQRARDEKSVQDKAEKERRKLQRDAAKTQKKLAIFETIITTPQAAMQAYKALAGIPIVGPALGASAAAATTALGLAKLKLIQDQPLPALAKGGIVQPSESGTIAQIGEAGSPEAVIPLTADVLGNLGSSIVNAINEKEPTSTIINNEVSERPVMVRNVVNIAGETFYDMISEATNNKQILVNSEAIVEI